MNRTILSAFFILISINLYCQAPTSLIEGFLELYHPEDSTSMYMGHRVGEILEFQDTARNTVIGNNSGIKIQNSHNNIVVGERSATNMTQSIDNVFIGNQIGDLMFNCNNNVAIGIRSGASLTSGNNNTFLGDKAGESVKSGVTNTLIGSQAGRKIRNANANTIIGFSAGRGEISGSFNNFLGFESGADNTSGTRNCFYGSHSGQNNTIGNYNTYMGHQAAKAFVLGSNNVIIGGESTGAIQFASGNYNVAIGVNAGTKAVNGNSNSFFGYEAGNKVTEGNNNTLIGYRAGFNLTTGLYNTIIGDAAGTSIYGIRNIVIGHSAGPISGENDNERLYIDVKNSNTPLIYGEFDNDLIQINGTLKSGNLYLENPNSDDGILSSDSSQTSSDLFLRSNDKVIIDLDANNDENATFSVRNSDGESILNLEENGNLTVDGTLVHTSDINRKHDIEKVDSKTVLDKIQSLDIATWKYNGASETHMGPMAQDFYTAFGLGGSDTTIATVDADGVALAAIKALSEENGKLKSEISDIKQQLESINALLNEK